MNDTEKISKEDFCVPPHKRKVLFTKKVTLKLAELPRLKIKPVITVVALLAILGCASPRIIVHPDGSIEATDYAIVIKGDVKTYVPKSWGYSFVNDLAKFFSSLIPAIGVPK